MDGGVTGDGGVKPGRLQSLQLLCFSDLAGHIVQMTRCVSALFEGSWRFGVYFCRSEARSHHLHAISPTFCLPLLSPGIPFPCVIRLLIKAVDVERMNAHSDSLSAGNLRAATQSLQHKHPATTNSVFVC